MCDEKDYVISLYEFWNSFYRTQVAMNSQANILPIGYIRQYDRNNYHDRKHGWFGPKMFGFFDFDGRLLMYRYGEVNLTNSAHQKGYIIQSLH